MIYDETINYLYSLQQKGIKFGLDNIKRLVSALENPHESFLSVHVAGTNGKGSTSAMIASILQAAGLKVGLFTSPHLVSFTERIRINGIEITENEIVRLAGEIRELVDHTSEFSPTFFEVVTAMALLYFKRREIDIAVMEVGMGGRLDATNIIAPEVSVITNIGYDHREFLGDTIAEIAYEKACIIKSGVPVVTSYQEPEVRQVLRKKAEEQQAGFYMYGKDFASVLRTEDISGIHFDYSDDSFSIHDLALPLTGEHQMQNASVAIKAVKMIFGGRKFKQYLPPHPPLPKGGTSGGDCSLIDESFIREGLKDVRWPGRLEFVHEDPTILIDAAHNPAAAVALSRTLKNTFLKRYSRIVMVLGIMNDKDIRGIMEPLLPLASMVVLTSPSYSRAASADRLADIAASLGFSNVLTATNVKDAIETAVDLT